VVSNAKRPQTRREAHTVAKPQATAHEHRLAGTALCCAARQPKPNPRAASTTNFFLSAAQPQPKDRGEINAFVPSWALCRAALKLATSSPNGGSCESDRRTNSSKAKCSNHALTCDFRADYPILCTKGRTVVTTLPAAREADTDKLSKLAV